MASEKSLAARTRKELAQMAKHNQVEGWHSMKKAQLIDALKNRRLKKGSQKNQFAERSQALRPEESDSRVALRRTQSQASEDETAPTSQSSRPPRLAPNAAAGEREELLATPQGSHWIVVAWKLTPEILDRAEASLGKDWHLATPVLRVFDVNARDDTSPAKRCLSTIPLHGAVDHWYVPIADPRRVYELQIGYQSPKGKFFLLARTGALKMPLPGSPQARKYDAQRSESAHTIAEANLRFPIRGSSAIRFSQDVSLVVEADLSVVGKATPHSHVTCQDQVVPTGPDGSFEVRLALEEGRQVIPLEAISPDGCQSRTVIVAIERNTKTLDPQPLNEWE